VRAQDQAAFDEEGVLHVAGGVVSGGVEGVEVVPLGLDPGAGADLEAHPGEDLLDLPAHQGERVQRPQPLAPPRQGDVHRALQLPGQLRLAQRAQARLDQALDGALGLVGLGADGAAAVGRHLAQEPHRLGQAPLLAQVARLGRPELLLGGQPGDLGGELGLQRLELRDQLGGAGLLAGHEARGLRPRARLRRPS
jgi:hypothetical protein